MPDLPTESTGTLLTRTPNAHAHPTAQAHGQQPYPVPRGGNGGPRYSHRFPRIILRDNMGRELQTDTTYQQAIAEARWRTARGEPPQYPVDWQLPHGTLPARPDMSRTAPPVAFHRLYKNELRRNNKVHDSMPSFVEALDAQKDFEQLKWSLQQSETLPALVGADLLQQETARMPQRTYLPFVGGAPYMNRPVSEVERRAPPQDHQFPGFCTGCTRMGLCYGCERDRNPHYHQDRVMRTGGGFTYFKRDKASREVAHNNPARWKVQPPPQPPTAYVYYDDMQYPEMDEYGIGMRVAKMPEDEGTGTGTMGVAFGRTETDISGYNPPETQSSATTEPADKSLSSPASRRTGPSYLDQRGRSFLTNTPASDLTTASPMRTLTAADGTSNITEEDSGFIQVDLSKIAGITSFDQLSAALPELSDLLTESEARDSGAGGEPSDLGSTSATSKRTGLYKAPKAFQLKKQERKVTVAGDPFSKDRVYDLPKGSGIDIKKSDKKLTEFIDIDRGDDGWKEPTKFELQDAEHDEIKPWVPPVHEEEKKTRVRTTPEDSPVPPRKVKLPSVTTDSVSTPPVSPPKEMPPTPVTDPRRVGRGTRALKVTKVTRQEGELSLVPSEYQHSTTSLPPIASASSSLSSTGSYKSRWSIKSTSSDGDDINSKTAANRKGSSEGIPPTSTVKMTSSESVLGLPRIGANHSLLISPMKTKTVAEEVRPPSEPVATAATPERSPTPAPPTPVSTHHTSYPPSSISSVSLPPMQPTPVPEPEPEPTPEPPREPTPEPVREPTPTPEPEPSPVPTVKEETPPPPKEPTPIPPTPPREKTPTPPTPPPPTPPVKSATPPARTPVIKKEKKKEPPVKKTRKEPVPTPPKPVEKPPSPLPEITRSPSPEPVAPPKEPSPAPTPAPIRKIPPPPLPTAVPPVPPTLEEYLEPEKPRREVSQTQLEVPPPMFEPPLQRKPPTNRNLKKPMLRDRRTKIRQAEAPITKQQLQDVSDPLDYLAKFCIIHPDRLPHYERIFAKVANEQLYRYVDVPHDDPLKQSAPPGEQVAHPVEPPSEEQQQQHEVKPEPGITAKTKLTDHERRMIEDMTVISRVSGPAYAQTGVNMGDQTVAKINFTLDTLIDKYEGLQDRMENMQTERVKMLAGLAKTHYPQITSADFTPGGKKSKKKGKKTEAAPAAGEVRFGVVDVIPPPEPPSPGPGSRGPRSLTDNDIVQRLDKKMMDMLIDDPTVSQLNVELERLQEKLRDVDDRIEDLEDERKLMQLFSRDVFKDAETKEAKPKRFMRRQSNLYQKMHPGPDAEMNLSEIEEALQQINGQLMTDREMQFIYHILDLPGRRRINVQMFSVVAALSEKVRQVDPWVRSMINKFNYEALSVKMDRAKELFYLLNEQDDEVPDGKITARSLAVELEAGGISPEHTHYVVDKFNRENKGVVDFLDFLTYVPLFIEIHSRIVQDPLCRERTW